MVVRRLFSVSFITFTYTTYLFFWLFLYWWFMKHIFICVPLQDFIIYSGLIPLSPNLIFPLPTRSWTWKCPHSPSMKNEYQIAKNITDPKSASYLLIEFEKKNYVLKIFNNDRLDRSHCTKTFFQSHFFLYHLPILLTFTYTYYLWKLFTIIVSI